MNETYLHFLAAPLWAIALASIDGPVYGSVFAFVAYLMTFIHLFGGIMTAWKSSRDETIQREIERLTKVTE